MFIKHKPHSIADASGKLGLVLATADNRISTVLARSTTDNELPAERLWVAKAYFG
jgi:hypothetical protein